MDICRTSCQQPGVSQHDLLLPVPEKWDVTVIIGNDGIVIARASPREREPFEALGKAQTGAGRVGLSKKILQGGSNNDIKEVGLNERQKEQQSLRKSERDREIVSSTVFYRETSFVRA